MSHVETPTDEYTPEFESDLEDSTDVIESWEPSDEKGTALHPGESEKDAYARVVNRVFHEILPERQKYDPEMQEVQDAYEGMLKMSRNPSNVASKMFPLVFMMVDAKLSTILAGRPRAVFEHTVEKAKIPFIEMMYEHFTSDTDDGVDLEVVDYIWHWYNELYGWSVKRIWHETEQWMEHEQHVVTEEDANGDEVIVYDADGYAQLEYERKLRRKSKVRQRVYKPDMVGVDPDAMFLYEADDMVFLEDMNYDEWAVKFKDNPRFENTDKVEPGKFLAPDASSIYAAEDSATGKSSLYHARVDLAHNKVRVMEYYGLSRDEYYVTFNGVKALHVPNPTPPVDGRKVLPAADLHNRLRPGSFYSRSEGKLVETIVVMWQRLLNAKARRAELASSPVVLTDTASGVAPKSYKVVPGAHWKGMYKKAETLNLAGVDTGEVREYIELLRDLAKVTTGVDFDRFIAEPDPTAQQQMAREAASKLRTSKDTRLQEILGHVRAMKITLANLQYYVTIPEIANIADMTDEEKEDLKDYDKIDDNTYYKYTKIPLKDKFYIEEVYDENSKKLSMKAQRKRSVKAKDYFFARGEFLRTKSATRVRAVSSRQQIESRALRLEAAMGLMEQAFGLPPKNQWEIEKAIAEKKPPPKPLYYISRTKAVERYIDANGEDVQEMTQDDDKLHGRPAEKLVREIFGGEAPTMGATPEQKKEIRQGVPTALSATQTGPSSVDLARVGQKPPQTTPAPQANPEEAIENAEQAAE